MEALAPFLAQALISPSAEPEQSQYGKRIEHGQAGVSCRDSGTAESGGKPALPTPLEGGYWLDNRGIGPTVAFLSYTYEEYIRLAAPPSREEMMERIVDKYPLTEIRACGRRADYKDIVTELNEKIRREGWK